MKKVKMISMRMILQKMETQNLKKMVHPKRKKAKMKMKTKMRKAKMMDAHARQIGVHRFKKN